MGGFLRHFGDVAALQQPFDIAVVTVTILRPSLKRAIDSVLEQDFPGRIQLLVGIDKALGSLDESMAGLDKIRPSRVVTFFDPGYSTAVRNGGLYSSSCGGILRCVLTYLANARYVAYLDDDNWWAIDHLRHLRAAIEGKAWAFAHRYFTHPETGRVVCRDSWESIGPNRGIFKDRFGGFVDPSNLMIDKIACEPQVRWWNFAMTGDPTGMTADRRVFNALRHLEPGESNAATVFYQVTPSDPIHPHRLLRMGAAWDEAARPVA